MDTLLEQATPRPWRYDEDDQSIRGERNAVAWVATDAEGRPYASEFDDGGAYADAELIVRAVNAYEPLVKALRRIEPLLTPDDRGRNWMNNDLALGIVRAALATVTESDSGYSVESSPEREGGE